MANKEIGNSRIKVIVSSTKMVLYETEVWTLFLHYLLVSNSLFASHNLEIYVDDQLQVIPDGDD